MPAKNKHTNNIFNGQLLHLQADAAFGRYGEAQSLISGDYKEVLNLDAGYYMQAAGPRAAYRYAMPDNKVFVRHTGNKVYELTDHLGNVRATVSDACKAMYQNGSWTSTAIVHNFNYYYPFGMLMPGLNGPANSTYRFGFNGQEKTDEIAGFGNHNTAQFWEYDTRTARRWNLDPKPQISISDYATFANNPIWNSDPLGDIFDVTNDDGKKDVTNLVAPSNQSYIKFTPVGSNYRVTLDFGSIPQQDIDNILTNDIGLKLINDLATAKTKPQKIGKDDWIEGKNLFFLYDASDNYSAIDRNTKKIIINKLVTLKSNILTAIRNDSKTPRYFGWHNFNGGNLPPRGYDGAVTIVPGKFIHKISGQDYRKSIVYHELRENYGRTALMMPYMLPDGSGAHKYSSLEEGNYYKNPKPGCGDGIEFIK